MLTTGQSAQRLSMSMSPEPRSVASVRRQLADDLHLWDADDLVVYAQLLVSEAVTNAICHAEGVVDVGVVAIWESPILRIEVHDADPTPLPALTRPDSTVSSGGRGLSLIDALASAWGCSFPSTGGKYVWFELHSP
ncbi:ATP-binding protein [Streptomyces sp. H10-C2]|uniref:ATP-binding protein n=1 Tax=unclassified Streptomyces TaxID=2593676 RepID=UPI0024B923D0|nr:MULTISPECIES: ATP-binding protein [unclassified Streptomyces]MDJ0344946.1 ATP-binding protein [Streptomyces sp. PH10-H1]MDJ0373796.1 ATP-binding protein [Streptomyces sp. H10-C2]